MALTLHDRLAVVIVAEDFPGKICWSAVNCGDTSSKRFRRAIIFEAAGVEALLTWLKENGFLPKVSG